jgi:hypothetical protein
MKKLACIYRWIIISVLLQVFVLSYLNFVYLPNRGGIKATMYEFGDDSVEDRSVKLPSGAKNIKVSYNGLFVAYTNGKNLEIMDIEKRRSIKTLEPSGGEYAYFRWLPDRDMLIYSLKNSVKGKGQVTISTYEIDTALDRSYPEIKGLPDGSTISDIELSPLTNVVYVLIKTGDTRTKLYKYNIMDDLSFVMNGGADFLMKEAAYTDTLFYQDGENKNVMYRNGKSGKSSTVSSVKNIRLLAVDSEDRAYIGRLDGDGRVTGIFFGKQEQKSKEWESLEIKNPVPPGDVFVTPDGSIYTVDRAAAKIYRPDGGAAGSFNGELLEVLDDYMVSLTDGRLELDPIEK